MSQFIQVELSGGHFLFGQVENERLKVNDNKDDDERKGEGEEEEEEEEEFKEKDLLDVVVVVDSGAELN